MINFQTKTIEDAARFWINRDFSMIPGTLLERAYKDDPEGLELLAGGGRVSDCHSAEITKRDLTADERATLDAGETIEAKYGGAVEPDDDDKIDTCDECGNVCETRWKGAEYGYPAAHTMMFCPNDSIDQDWIRNNAEEIADKCGFLVYSCDETGVILGIDGGGYDFYEAHWIPLYTLRGFEWHDTTPAAPAPKPAAKRASKRKAPRKASGKSKAPKRKARR